MVFTIFMLFIGVGLSFLIFGGLMPFSMFIDKFFDKYSHHGSHGFHYNNNFDNYDYYFNNSRLNIIWIVLIGLIWLIIIIVLTSYWIKRYKIKNWIKWAVHDSKNSKKIILDLNTLKTSKKEFIDNRFNRKQMRKTILKYSRKRKSKIKSMLWDSGYSENDLFKIKKINLCIKLYEVKSGMVVK